MKLSQLPPTTRVRLHFVSKVNGEKGTLDTTVEHALNPNQSQRFFPPEGVSPVQLNWPVPYWYAEECVEFELV